MDSSDVYERLNTFTAESHHKSLWSQQITITLTENALLIFLQSRVEKLLAYGPGIEPITLDLRQVPMTP